MAHDIRGQFGRMTNLGKICLASRGMNGGNNVPNLPRIKMPAGVLLEQLQAAGVQSER